MKEIAVCHFNLVCLCTCVIHEKHTVLRSHTRVYNPSGFSCPDQRLSVHVAPAAHVHLRRSSNLKDKPSFLTTSVVSPTFPFCKLHNLSFEALATLPSQ